MTNEVQSLEARVQRLEDESAINRLIMSYGPAADAGMSQFAGDLWLEDGLYDWDANGEPHVGSAGVDAMLQTAGHRGLMAAGVAHFAGPLMLKIHGDTATALNYSIIMRREEDRFYVWRTSAVRWDLERTGGGWRVRRRTNRLMDSSGSGLQLLGNSLQELFEAELSERETT